MYLSRVASRQAGVPDHAPALTMNRLCGSGLQAIVSAVQAITLGDGDVTLAGGAENMSRAGYLMPSARWGQRMGDAAVVDMMLGALHDPFGIGHMGITAENVAEKYGISREDQDAFAVESHRRASEAVKEGRFKDQIVPLTIWPQRQGKGFRHRRARPRRRQPGGHGQASSRVQKGWSGNSWQRFRSQ